MPDFRYGAVEIYLLAFPGQEPAAGSLGILREVLSTGMLRLLDLVAVRKDQAGHVAMLDPAGRDRLRLGVAPDSATEGLIGEEDLVELAAPLACGSSAAVLVLELRFELLIADQLAHEAVQVHRAARIPAPVVNALIDLYHPGTPEPTRQRPTEAGPDVASRRVARPGLIGLATRTAALAGIPQEASGEAPMYQQRQAQDRDAQSQYAVAHQQARIEAAALAAMKDSRPPAPPQTGPRADPGSTSFLDDLQRLAELRRSGLLSEEEFAAAKARLFR